MEFHCCLEDRHVETFVGVDLPVVVVAERDEVEDFMFAALGAVDDVVELDVLVAAPSTSVLVPLEDLPANLRRDRHFETAV